MSLVFGWAVFFNALAKRYDRPGYLWRARWCDWVSGRLYGLSRLPGDW